MAITLDGTNGITTPDVSTDDGVVYAKGNIVGTVSQSGGVPTGAIIERGSNANGQFTKYADGTMICAITADEVRSATGVVNTVVTFPASFIDAAIAPRGIPYAPQLTIFGAPANFGGVTVGNETLTSIEVRINRTSGTTGVPFALTITGRWF